MNIPHLNAWKGIRRVSAFVLPALLLSATCLPSDGQVATGRIRHHEHGYRVQIGDAVGVQVYHQPDLSRDAILVRPDGFATFPGAGELPVAGETVEDIARMLEGRLAGLVRRPVVSVGLSRMRAPTLYVSGAVMRPGRVQEPAVDEEEGGKADRMGDFRLSSVLARAGGVQLNADLRHVEVHRADGRLETVNLWPLLETGQAREDLLLGSGDGVHIRTLDAMVLPDEYFQLLLRSSIGPKAFPVRLLGEVEKPGVYELPGRSPYLNSAIAQAGGYRVGARRKRVVIRRFTNEHDFADITVDPARLDFMLRPNDVVLVTERRLAEAGRHAELLGKALSPLGSAASAVMGYALWSGGR